MSPQEHYVEYSRLGNVIKGQEKAVAKSRYEEDVYNNNHTVRHTRTHAHTCTIPSSTLLAECLGLLLGKWEVGLCLLPLSCQGDILLRRSWEAS